MIRVTVRIPIRYRIIAPFALLLLLVGALGTGLATSRLSDAASAEFDASLLRTSLLANERLQVLEADRLALLRQAADTLGVPEAAAAGDQDKLATLLVPIVANAAPANLVARVLDANGEQVIGVQRTPSGTVAVDRSPSLSFVFTPAVQDALTGRGDGIGDKYVFLFNAGAAAVLYWSGPIRLDNGQVVGAILVGQPVAEIVAGVTGIALYDGGGRVMSSSMPATPQLSDEIRRLITSEKPLRIKENLSGHTYGDLFSDWTLRGGRLGFLAVELPADQLESSAAQVRLLLTLVFTAAALITLLIGSAIASSITGPLASLVGAMRRVSAGDLQQRAVVGSSDEIGYLARTFNEMTTGLQEKNRQLEDTYFASMEALARAIDARDPHTFGHSSRVAAISLEIAGAMHLPAEERDALWRGALLHDIGKIGVADRVLRKPARLDEEEAGSMREHPRIGHDMLKGLRFLEPALPGVRHHHERWDGGGYPDGLLGEQIPLRVRILTVADVFDALTSDRPYRRGLSVQQATDFIVGESGSQFDPKVVEAFLACRDDNIVRVLERLGKAEAEPNVLLFRKAS
jgi:putative nucleotidyltransferase with HDIG domain